MYCQVKHSIQRRTIGFGAMMTNIIKFVQTLMMFDINV